MPACVQNCQPRARYRCRSDCGRSGPVDDTGVARDLTRTLERLRELHDGNAANFWVFRVHDSKLWRAASLILSPRSASCARFRRHDAKAEHLCIDDGENIPP